MNQNGEWSEINVTNRDLFAVWAACATIVATGADGMMILSEDNGVSFNILDGKTHSDLWGVWGRNATDFWVTGRSKTSCTLLHRRYSRGKVSFRKKVTRKKMQGCGLVGCGETVLLTGNHVHRETSRLILAKIM